MVHRQVPSDSILVGALPSRLRAPPEAPNVDVDQHAVTGAGLRVDDPGDLRGAARGRGEGEPDRRGRGIVGPTAAPISWSSAGAVLLLIIHPDPDDRDEAHDTDEDQRECRRGGVRPRGSWTGPGRSSSPRRYRWPSPRGCRASRAHWSTRRFWSGRRRGGRASGRQLAGRCRRRHGGCRRCRRCSRRAGCCDGRRRRGLRRSRRFSRRDGRRVTCRHRRDVSRTAGQTGQAGRRGDAPGKGDQQQDEAESPDGILR